MIEHPAGGCLGPPDMSAAVLCSGGGSGANQNPNRTLGLLVFLEPHSGPPAILRAIEKRQ